MLPPRAIDTTFTAPVEALGTPPKRREASVIQSHFALVVLVAVIATMQWLRFIEEHWR